MTEEITGNEVYEVSTAMIEYGGGFVSRLGHALVVADIDNATRIKKAFPEYWNQYQKIYNERIRGV